MEAREGVPVVAFPNSYVVMQAEQEKCKHSVVDCIWVRVQVRIAVQWKTTFLSSTEPMSSQSRPATPATLE